MRLAIAIGVNSYDSLDPLDSAESDAQRMFDALVAPDHGCYDPVASMLLLSPDLPTVMEALHKALSVDSEFEAVTIFFAGHGVVKAGSFYMCVRNTIPGSFSTTALALVDVFRILAEKAPRQSNIIIDACESGGLIQDLSGLLKPENLGNAGTPEITLIATAAQDESAGETVKGGFGTNAILACMLGNEFVQDFVPTLTLTEIGRHISKTLPPEAAQNPAVWGLNLSGATGFCKNPFYGKDPAQPFREIVRGWSAGADELVRKNHDQLYQVYADVAGDEWNPRQAADRLAPVFSGLSMQPEALVAFTERLTNALLSRADESDEIFRAAEAAAVIAACLLEYAGCSANQDLLGRVLERLGVASLAASSELLENLHREPRFLLPRRGGGLSELFYLPVRIPLVLGWTAATVMAFPAGDPRSVQAKSHFSQLLKIVLTKYSGSIVAICDRQAPGYAVSLAVAIDGELVGEAEELVGYLFHSLTEHRGQIARDDISPEMVLDFLLARSRNDGTMPPELTAKPAELTSVLFRAAILLGLETVCDDALWKLDRHNLVAYFPADYTHFGSERMQGGRNLLWQVGFDVFRLADFGLSWPAPMHLVSAHVDAAATFASLIYPDRVAWHLLSDRVAATQT